VRFREAERSDVPAMARIRAASWGTEDYWSGRIARYMDSVDTPGHALAPRVLYVAVANDSLAGLIAGHRTRRFDCQGELEWIDVTEAHRGTGVASELLHHLAAWFVRENARRVCVDVEPDNTRARRFYARHGARPLDPHWMVWDDIGCVFEEAQA
jgi:GNAT superfamily N-acetyltransferase